MTNLQTTPSCVLCEHVAAGRRAHCPTHGFSGTPQELPPNTIPCTCPSHEYAYQDHEENCPRLLAERRYYSPGENTKDSATRRLLAEKLSEIADKLLYLTVEDALVVREAAALLSAERGTPQELWELLHWNRDSVRPPDHYSVEAQNGWRQAMAQARTILSDYQKHGIVPGGTRAAGAPAEPTCTVCRAVYSEKGQHVGQPWGMGGRGDFKICKRCVQAGRDERRKRERECGLTDGAPKEQP